MKPHTVILGVGSPFGDDRAGWAVAEAVRASAWFQSLAPGSVAVEWLDRPGASLLTALEGVAHAVLIDAMRSGAPPGTVREVGVDALIGSPAGLTSSHGFDLPGALQLGRVLGLLPPRLTILAVEAGPGKGLDGLSVEVRAAVPQVLKCIEAVIGGNALVSLLDAKSGERVTDAEITARVTGPRQPEEKRLLHVPLGSEIAYGNFFGMRQGERYRIELVIRRAGSAQPVTAGFDYRHRF